MASYATPGVYFESVDQSDAAVATIRTDIAAFIGIAQQGPVHKPTATNSWEQFQSTFGSFIPNGYLAYSAKAFFDNGGQRLYGVRVAAPKAGTKTAPPPAVQPADGSASIVQSVKGFAAGALVTARQTATANAAGSQPADRKSSIVNAVDGFPEGSAVQITQAGPPEVQDWHKVTAVDPGANRLYWDSALDSHFDLMQPINFRSFHQAACLLNAVDPGTNTLTWVNPLGPMFNVNQAIQLDTGHAESMGILYDAVRKATLRVRASSPGAWGDALAVEVAHSNLAATATAPTAQPSTGDFSYVQSIAGFPCHSVVRVYQLQPSQSIVGYRLVMAREPITNALTWDKPLAPTFDVNSPMSFETVEFSLTVYLNGSVKEVFAGLSLECDHPRYVEKVVNPQMTAKAKAAQTALPSQYIRVEDLHSSTDYPGNLPDPGAPQLNEGMLNLWGGRDGIAALRPQDFTGDPASDKKWGLRTLEDVDEISIVAVPDILIEPAPAVAYSPLKPKPPNPCLPGSKTVPVAAPPVPPPVEAAPQFSLNDVLLVQQAVVAHCEAMQFRFAILDPPDFSYPEQHVDLGEVQTWRNRFDTEFAALYYPWVLVLDPLQPGNQLVRRVPPSGHVAGVYANTDLTTGVFQAPANAALQWAQDLTTEVTAAMQAVLNPIGVDCIRAFPGRGIRVYGARTLSSDPSWRFVNVRRLISMIEHASLLSMQWSVFEPNDTHLWTTVNAAISSFLEAIWKKGALAGNTAEESFYVKVDQTNNPPATVAAGQMVVEVGVAPALPAEFVVFRIGRAEDTLQISE